MANKALAEHTKDELIKMVCHLKECKKFGLLWEDKPEKVAKDCQIKLPILNEVVDKAINVAPDQPTNIIIEGDNYHALSVLNYTHAGKIDVIYIDPPYNTGKAKEWKYNDRFVDSNDAYKHSKWLSFMAKRLALSKDLLKNTGMIFISIDDKEQARLKLLCDEIFAPENYVGMFIWRKKSGGGQTDDYFVKEHEYIIVYRKSEKSGWSDSYLSNSIKAVGKDEYGEFSTTKLEKWGTSAHKEDRPTMYYPILNPDGNEFFPVAPDGKDGRWRVGKVRMEKLIENNGICWKKIKGNWIPYEKNYIENHKGKLDKSRSILYKLAETGTGTKALTDIFGEKDAFENPKPVELIQFLIKHFSKHAIILDFFAGSGTTGQAIMELNTNDEGERQFILCTNNENNIAEEVTYPRIKTVITGIRSDKSEYSKGIPANVRYFKTDFVDKDKSNDRLREKMAPLCTDMIKIRENCFDSIIDSDKLKVLQNKDGLVALVFDNYDLAPHIAQIEKIKTGAPVKLYVFSYDANTREWEMPKKTKYKYINCPIPEGVLAVYRRIFKTKDNTDV